MRSGPLGSGFGGSPIHTWQIKAISNNRPVGSMIGQIHWVGRILAMMVCLSAPVFAQEESATDTRADQIQAERMEKQAVLTPEELTPGEKELTRIKHTTERLLQGNVHLQLGGLRSGSGFALGPVFQWSNSTDSMRAEFSSVGSLSQFYRVGAGLTFPKFGTRSLSLSLQTSHSDAPRLNYYGSGPNSLKGNRTDYREENTVGELSLRWAPWQNHIIMKAEGGEVLVNVGPGTRRDVTSTELRYGPSEAPGVDVQTNFLRGSASLELDGRDSVGDPHKGGRLAFQYQHYWDLKRSTYSFSRMSGDAQAYVPFFNRKRVIALRARVDLTHPDPNQTIPFYLQPILGEAGDFRGFRPYRYRGNNLLLLNAEYRWEVSSGFDMALFGDSGRVFDKARQMNLSHLKNSVGFGFRFKSRDAVVIRIDTGFSREGWQSWVRFGNVF